jgi:5-methylcytosine-specific restriction enzyme A
MPIKPPQHGIIAKQTTVYRPAKKVLVPRSSCKAGYGREWRKKRAHVIRMQPICAMCKVKLSHHVDHITSKVTGGDESMDNLQGLCHSCHSKKTYQHDGGLGNTRRL